MSVPCECCQRNILNGFMVKAKKDHPDEDDRFICSSCVEWLSVQQKEWIDDPDPFTKNEERYKLRP